MMSTHPRTTFRSSMLAFLLVVISHVRQGGAAPTGSAPGKRSHYICGPTDQFCQFYEVCDVQTRPNCPCIDSEGPGRPIFTHACPPFHSCEPFSPDTQWLYHVCKPFEGSPGPGGSFPDPGDEDPHEDPHEGDGEGDDGSAPPDDGGDDPGEDEPETTTESPSTDLPIPTSSEEDATTTSEDDNLPTASPEPTSIDNALPTTSSDPTSTDDAVVPTASPDPTSIEDVPPTTFAAPPSTSEAIPTSSPEPTSSEDATPTQYPEPSNIADPDSTSGEGEAPVNEGEGEAAGDEAGDTTIDGEEATGKGEGANTDPAVNDLQR